MNAYKATTATTTRKGYWFDFETNRANKPRSRRKARRVLKADLRKEIA